MKTKVRKFVVLIVSVSLILMQLTPCYAADNYATDADLRELFSQVHIFLDNFNELGLTVEDCMDLLALTDPDLANISYLPQVTAIYDYDGNPPKDDQEQEDRLANIHEIATRNYKTIYYQGPKSGKGAFGKYLFYLYLSHYVDGPGRAPSSAQLPYIITTTDISAYHKFINEQNMGSLLNEFAKIGETFSSATSIESGIKNILHKNEICKNVIEGSIAGLSIFSDSKDIKDIITRSTKIGILDNYNNSNNIEELANKTMAYVNGELMKVYKFSDQDKKIVDSVAWTIIDFMVGIVFADLTLLGAAIAVGPAFTYTFVGIVKKTSLLALGTTLSGRVVDRTMVEIEG